jgi:hypothetical protein
MIYPISTRLATKAAQAPAAVVFPRWDEHVRRASDGRGWRLTSSRTKSEISAERSRHHGKRKAKQLCNDRTGGVWLDQLNVEDPALLRRNGRPGAMVAWKLVGACWYLQGDGRSGNGWLRRIARHRRNSVLLESGVGWDDTPGGHIGRWWWMEPMRCEASESRGRN